MSLVNTCVCKYSVFNNKNPILYVYIVNVLVYVSYSVVDGCLVEDVNKIQGILATVS